MRRMMIYITTLPLYLVCKHAAEPQRYSSSTIDRIDSKMWGWFYNNISLFSHTILCDFEVSTYMSRYRFRYKIRFIHTRMTICSPYLCQKYYVGTPLSLYSLLEEAALTAYSCFYIRYSSQRTFARSCVYVTHHCALWRGCLILCTPTYAYWLTLKLPLM